MKIDSDGCFVNAAGDIFVRCMANPDKPIFISVTGDAWRTQWRGRTASIDFSRFSLPLAIIDCVKLYLKEKLEKKVPSVMGTVSAMLNELNECWSECWPDFTAVGLKDLWVVWSECNVFTRYELRRFYKFCSQNGMAGAKEEISIELEGWKARNVTYFKDVFEWDQIFGALTSDEVELLRQKFTSRPVEESCSDLLSRISIWILFETFKRPKQLTEMDNESLWVIKANEGEPEYFLNIPKIKYQTGRDPEAWPITPELAAEIERYSLLPEVKEEQQRKGRLLISNATRMPGILPDITRFIQRWVKRQNIISPRTGNELNFTSNRIRHTGGTQLAMQGVSADEIQYILEHDSKWSANAYIDSLSSELCPLIERADQRLGGLFSTLAQVFFKGNVSSELGAKQILIPVVAQPAVIGSCGFDGRCSKHPLYSCYNGCRYFIAWKDADHHRVLAYIEAEFLRWSSAEGGNQRSKAVKDFERLYKSVLEVIEKIKLERGV